MFSKSKRLGLQLQGGACPLWWQCNQREGTEPQSQINEVNLFETPVHFDSHGILPRKFVWHLIVWTKTNQNRGLPGFRWISMMYCPSISLEIFGPIFFAKFLLYKRKQAPTEATPVVLQWEQLPVSWLAGVEEHSIACSEVQSKSWTEKQQDIQNYPPAHEELELQQRRSPREWTEVHKRDSQDSADGRCFVLDIWNSCNVRGMVARRAKVDF